jgi:hypothetical protein
MLFHRLKCSVICFNFNNNSHLSFDSQRWAFSFQTFAIFSRLAALREAQKQIVPGVTRAIVMERSWLSDRQCFASLLRDSGAIDPLEEVRDGRILIASLICSC